MRKFKPTNLDPNQVGISNQQIVPGQDRINYSPLQEIAVGDVLLIDDERIPVIQLGSYGIVRVQRLPGAAYHDPNRPIFRETTKPAAQATETPQPKTRTRGQRKPRY